MSTSLLHGSADIVRWLLVAKGFLTSPLASPLQPWPCYESKEPSSPDNCVTIYDTSGFNDGRAMVDGELFVHDGIQVRIRSIDKPTGAAKVNALYKQLSENIYQDQVTIDGTVYQVHCISKFGNVLFLGKDVPNTKRSLWTINAAVSLRQL